MHDIPAFAAEKEKRSKKAFIHLLEIDYAGDHTNNHAACQFVRYCRYDQPTAPWQKDVATQWTPPTPPQTPVTFEGFTWVPFPMSKPTRSEYVSSEIPAMDIAVSGVGREIASILEFYDIEQRPGRTIRVHPDHLADPTAKKELKFIVKSARVMMSTAIITVTPLIFDPMQAFLPRRRVTATEFPGILGAGTFLR
jgi:hypothetical protein